LIAVFVEGPSDAGFIEEVCRRLGVSCRAFVLGGNKPGKVARKIRAVAPNFDGVVVLKDVHGLRREILARLEEEILRGVGGSTRIRVLLVEKSVESWILAGLCEERAEELDEAGLRLMERLGRIVVKTFEEYRRLAQAVDLEHATKKSKSFRAFAEAVRELRSV